jgi:ankyrin repeat protein
MDTLNALLASGADPNSARAGVFGGGAPLHCAALMDRAEVARALLAAGANVDMLDGGGNAPLDYAAEEGHVELVKLLIAAGANVSGGCGIAAGHAAGSDSQDDPGNVMRGDAVAGL